MDLHSWVAPVVDHQHLHLHHPLLLFAHMTHRRRHLQDTRPCPTLPQPSTPPTPCNCQHMPTRLSAKKGQAQQQATRWLPLPGTAVPLARALVRPTCSGSDWLSTLAHQTQADTTTIRSRSSSTLAASSARPLQPPLGSARHSPTTMQSATRVCTCASSWGPRSHHNKSSSSWSTCTRSKARQLRKRSQCYQRLSNQSASLPARQKTPTLSATLSIQ